MEVLNKVIVFGGGLINTLGLVRSIGRMGKKVDLVVPAPELEKSALASSRYVNRVVALENKDMAAEVLLQEYSGEPYKPVVLCECDALMSVLDSHLDELLTRFHIFNANRESGRINFFLDKVNQFVYAERCGLATIPTWRLSSGDAIPSDIAYPCITKGVNSTRCTKGDMHICADESALKSAINDRSDFIVQSFIAKEYELDVVGFAYENGKRIFLPAVVRKIREGLYRQSDCIRIEAVDKYPSLDIEGIKRLVASIGYEGIFIVEFIYANEKYYFLEINLRNDGTSYLYTTAGVNYPWLWVLYNSVGVDESILSELKFRGSKTLVQVYDFLNVIEKKLSFREWLNDLVKADAFFVFDLKDPMPFFASTWELAVRAVNKFTRNLRWVSNEE